MRAQGRKCNWAGALPAVGAAAPVTLHVEMEVVIMVGNAWPQNRLEWPAAPRSDDSEKLLGFPLPEPTLLHCHALAALQREARDVYGIAMCMFAQFCPPHVVAGPAGIAIGHGDSGNPLTIAALCSRLHDLRDPNRK